MILGINYSNYLIGCIIRYGRCDIFSGLDISGQQNEWMIWHAVRYNQIGILKILSKRIGIFTDTLFLEDTSPECLKYAYKKINMCPRKIIGNIHLRILLNDECMNLLSLKIETKNIAIRKFRKYRYDVFKKYVTRDSMNNFNAQELFISAMRDVDIKTIELLENIYSRSCQDYLAEYINLHGSKSILGLLHSEKIRIDEDIIKSTHLYLKSKFARIMKHYKGDLEFLKSPEIINGVIKAFSIESFNFISTIFGTKIFEDVIFGDDDLMYYLESFDKDASKFWNPIIAEEFKKGMYLYDKGYYYNVITKRNIQICPEVFKNKVFHPGLLTLGFMPDAKVIQLSKEFVFGIIKEL